MQVKYRSRLNSLPIDLKEQLAEVVLQWGMTPAARAEKLQELFKDFHIDSYHAGTGTNRLIMRYQGYAIKIALDDEGIADNMQEWAVSPLLVRGRAKTHEISGHLEKSPDGTIKMNGGHLLVASYCPAFTSYAEMSVHQSKIRSILSFWSNNGFLLGDVGMQQKNFANWGIDPRTREPVCIDYAYIFPANTELYQCLCGNRNLVPYDNSFSSYRCPACGRRYEDRELRMRISNEMRLSLFSKVEGVEMKQEFETHEIDDKYKPINQEIQTPYSINEYEIAKSVSSFLMKNGLYDFM